MTGAAEGSAEAELEPLGSDAGISAAQSGVEEQHPVEYEPYPGFADAQRIRFTVDGIVVPYEIAIQMLGARAASLDPETSRLRPGGVINIPEIWQATWVPDKLPDEGDCQVSEYF